MKSIYKLSAITILPFFISACGGSSSDAPDEGNKQQQLVYIEDGAKSIKTGYSPLRINAVNLRSEEVLLRIDQPTIDSGLVLSTLDRVRPGFSLPIWRSGYKSSIQVKNSDINTKLKITVSSFYGASDPWEFTTPATVENKGHFIFLPLETDLNDELPIAFIESNEHSDITMQASQVSFINRFKHSSLMGDDAAVCLALIDNQNNVHSYETSLAISDSSVLIEHNNIKQLAVVTNALLNKSSLASPVSSATLMAIAHVCPSFTVANGETVRILDLALPTSGQYSQILYSATDGDIRFYSDERGDATLLPSLKWQLE
ncbi:hypothetical protein ACRWQM_15975 [Shewanella sp. HL-SH5]|uniref:hypothetical protein n=1 Tax=Shewanella sp. HL-SH5 TaxID=3436241 RepID=UPI003EBE4B9F